MSAVDAVRADPTGRKFPWGQRRGAEKKPAAAASSGASAAAMDESAAGGVAGATAASAAATSAYAAASETDEEEEEGIVFEGLRFSRPYLHYFADEEKPPPALPPSEAWIVPLLTPILEAVYPEMPPDQKMSYSLFLPQHPARSDATAVRLIGMDDEGKEYATWKEVVCVRALNVVNVYTLLSHGRRMYRSLVWSSDKRLSLHSLAPMHWNAPPSKQIPKCIVNAGGDWRRKRQPDPSLVIVRTEPLSGRRETLVPTRNLAGVVPTALLDAMRFWQGEDLVLRGYPRARSDEWFGYSVEVKLEATRGGGGGGDAVEPHRQCAFIKRIPIMAASSSGLSTLAARSPLREKTQKTEDDAASASASEAGDALALPPPLVRTLSQQTRLTPLTSAGYSEAAAAHALDLFSRADGRDDMALAEGWLSDPRHADEISQLDAAAAVAVMPPLPPQKLDRFISSAGGVRGDRSPPRAGAGTSERSGGGGAAALSRGESIGSEMSLFNLTRVREGTALVRLVKTLSRIEDISHVLAWSTDGSRARWAHAAAVSESESAR
jgi:hypothetical protein